MPREVLGDGHSPQHEDQARGPPSPPGKERSTASCTATGTAEKQRAQVASRWRPAGAPGGSEPHRRMRQESDAPQP